MKHLLIDEASAKLIDTLIEKAKSTKAGLITNFDDPYGISFDELALIGDRLKYGDDFVEKRENERIRLELEYKEFIHTAEGKKWLEHVKKDMKLDGDLGDYLYDFYPELLQ